MSDAAMKPVKPQPLSRNEALVLEALERADNPLSAYAILDVLRDQGLRAPPQVYRALERLQTRGHVHRLESINAYVACQGKHHIDLGAPVFVICESCGQTDELADKAIGRDLARLASGQHFETRVASVELRGRCRVCAQAS